MIVVRKSWIVGAALLAAFMVTALTPRPGVAQQAAPPAPLLPVALTLHGDPGAYVVEGTKWLPPEFGPWSIRDEGTDIFLSLDGEERWDVAFGTGDETLLQPGTYLGAGRAIVDRGIPVMDLTGRGLGCNKVAGWFSVDELHRQPDGRLASLAVTFEFHCEALFPPITGRLIVGGAVARHPAVFPDQMMIADSAVHWSRVQPVLVAPPRATTVQGVRIHGVHSDEVVVARDECTGNRASRSEPCPVWLSATPRGAGPRFAVVDVDFGDTVTSVPIAYEGQGGRTRLVLDSDPGDFIGQGKKQWFDARLGAVVRLVGDASDVEATLKHAGRNWRVLLGARDGEELTVGRTYTDSRSETDRTDVYLEVSGEQRGCGRSIGTFTPDALQLRDGQAEQISVTFEQRCTLIEPTTGLLRGVFEHRHPIGDQDPPAPVSNLRAELHGDGSARRGTLSWGVTTDTAVVLVRRSDGTQPPAVTRAGTSVAAGRITTTTLPAPAGQDTAVAVFPVDANGNVGASRAMVISASGAVTATPGVEERSSGGTPPHDPRMDPDPFCVVHPAGCNDIIESERLAGSDRYATAVAMSKWWWDRSASAVVLARGDVAADALAGVALAAHHDAPLLLTRSSRLPQDVHAELDRVLQPGGVVHVLGGPQAIATSIDDTLLEEGFGVYRLAGANRYETAVAIAEHIGDGPTVLVDGTDFADALAAGPIAALHDGAVLLTRHDHPAPETLAALKRRSGPVVALGGPAAAAHPDVAAIVGVNRYDTAARAADRYLPGPHSVVMARGDDPADALAGGALAARTGGPVLTTPSTSLAGEAATYLCAHGDQLQTAFGAGGTGALQDQVLEAAIEALSNPSASCDR